MPFQNMKVDLTSLAIREQASVERVIGDVLHECNRYNGLIRIINSMKKDPPRSKANKKDFFDIISFRKRPESC